VFREDWLEVAVKGKLVAREDRTPGTRPSSILFFVCISEAKQEAIAVYCGLKFQGNEEFSSHPGTPYPYRVDHKEVPEAVSKVICGDDFLPKRTHLANACLRRASFQQRILLYSGKVSQL
jgi:hypothetical protein